MLICGHEFVFILETVLLILGARFDALLGARVCAHFGSKIWCSFGSKSLCSFWELELSDPNGRQPFGPSFRLTEGRFVIFDI